MAFLALISMIGILNMASCHVNFSLLKALAERLNHQTNTLFLPTSETTLVGSAYQPSTATNDHSIMGARLLGAAYSSHGQWVDMELLVWNRKQSRAAEHIYIFHSSKFPYSFGPCLLGASRLHHCSGRVGRHLPGSSQPGHSR
ncbi:hypothetical protein AMTRI_Chr09g18500 [Amborella trichopoda]